MSSSNKPVFIECGSANSFELSPRFANMAIRGSREAVHLDVENELREAMSDTVKDEGESWPPALNLSFISTNSSLPAGRTRGLAQLTFNQLRAGNHNAVVQLFGECNSHILSLLAVIYPHQHLLASALIHIKPPNSATGPFKPCLASVSRNLTLPGPVPESLQVIV